MNQRFKNIDKFLAQICIYIIYIYQYTLSPDKGIFSPILKGKICAHEPHCSEYGIRIFKRYGFRHGLPKITDRILSCKPSKEKMYDPEHYRIIFFSSAEIGIPFLKELINDKRFEVVGVVTQEDKPVGRGLTLTANIIKTTALENGISNEDIYTPTEINPDKSLEGKNFNDRLIKKAPDYFIVIAYGKIIPQVILDIPVIGAINIHGSLLPKYRGASPLQTIFLNNEEKSGITIMHMDKKMDTGNIIDQLTIKIPFNRTVKSLIEKFKEVGPYFLNTTLREYAKGKIKTTPQNEDKATYCKKIMKEDGKIDPYNEPIKSIYSKYRGYCIWPKIRFTLNNKKIGIEELIIEENTFNSLKDTPLFDKNNQIHKAIQHIIFKPEGKQGMDYKSFKNGYLK